MRPEGRNRRGETWLRGPEVLGPLSGLGIRPLVSVIRGLGNPFPLPRGPLEARKGSQGLGGGSSGDSERCVRFQRSGERRWAIQRPLRGPVFPDAPSWVPTLGFLPSGCREHNSSETSAPVVADPKLFFLGFWPPKNCRLPQNCLKSTV